MGIEAEHGGGHAGADGEDVPEVERDDVGDEEVYVLGGIDGAGFADGVGGAGFVGVGAEGVGGFDLDTEEAASVVEDEVVALAVTPGFGDAESERAGFLEESGFAALAATLGVLAAGAGGLGMSGVGRRADWMLQGAGSLKKRKAQLLAAPLCLAYSYSMTDGEGNCARKGTLFSAVGEGVRGKRAERGIDKL